MTVFCRLTTSTFSAIITLPSEFYLLPEWKP